MSLKEDALKFHKENEGKLGVYCKANVTSKEELSLAYSPGVAEPCLEIARDNALAYEYTAKGNFVACISNGTAVLGLGNLGALASIPVMEGKAMLFKMFGGLDCIPLCLDTENVDEIVRTVELLAPTLGGINLEDIKAPQCFEVEERVKKSLNIPVWHDDQHGTAVVTLAGLINSLKLVNKKIEDVKIVINGPGSAGIAIAKLLLSSGAKNVIMCGRKGAMHKGECPYDNPYKDDLMNYTNLNREEGTLSDVLHNADVFIGVSIAGAIDENDIKNMNENAIIFGLANPEPEIMPDLALKAGAKVMCTGRSDFPNQVNNVLAFPGLFRGAIDIRATEINEAMKVAAAHAIASLITDEELSPDYVIPDTFDKRIAPLVAKKVAEAALETGVSTSTTMTPELIYQKTIELTK